MSSMEDSADAPPRTPLVHPIRGLNPPRGPQMSLAQSSASGVGAAIHYGRVLLGSIKEVEEFRIRAPEDSLQDIGELAEWSVSSAKLGSGVAEARDWEDTSTFWQSDAAALSTAMSRSSAPTGDVDELQGAVRTLLGNGQTAHSHAARQVSGNPDGVPHILTLEFEKYVKVSEVWLWLDPELDDSYTPRVIGVRIGHTPDDTEEVQRVEVGTFAKAGWMIIPLAKPPGEPRDVLSMGEHLKILDPHCQGAYHFVRCFTLQIVIVASFQNGRDTHVRGIRVLGPKEETVCVPVLSPFHLDLDSMFAEVEAALKTSRRGGTSSLRACQRENKHPNPDDEELEGEEGRLGRRLGDNGSNGGREFRINLEGTTRAQSVGEEAQEANTDPEEGPRGGEDDGDDEFLSENVAKRIASALEEHCIGVLGEREERLR